MTYLLVDNRQDVRLICEVGLSAEKGCVRFRLESVFHRDIPLGLKLAREIQQGVLFFPKGANAYELMDRGWEDRLTCAGRMCRLRLQIPKRGGDGLDELDGVALGLPLESQMYDLYGAENISMNNLVLGEMVRSLAEDTEICPPAAYVRAVSRNDGPGWISLRAFMPGILPQEFLNMIR